MERIAKRGPLAASVVVVFLSAALSGCVSESDSGDVGHELHVYQFTMEGSNVAVPGVDHGWLFKLHNPSNETVTFWVGAYGVHLATLGPATADGWMTVPEAPELAVGVLGESLVWGGAVELSPDEHVAYLANVQHYTGTEAGLKFVGETGAILDVPVDVTPGTDGTLVLPGDHVQTVTVGVWLNGTSFYTNSGALLNDPKFPAGGNIDLDAAKGQTDLLPIYVYGEDRTEQPEGSKDTCHFTTITGYNAIMQQQSELSSRVGWMAPEDAYTRAGAEGHFLYGDALVFLNTIVVHDGSTEMADAAPSPTGACFDPTRNVPALPLPL